MNNWVVEKIRPDYIAAEVQIEYPIFVKKSRFISTGAEKLLELGPVWTYKFTHGDMQGLICDLFVRSKQTGEFTRLRLPNCSSSISVANDWRQWIVREVGSHTGTHPNALSNKDLVQALITGRMRDERTPSPYYRKLLLEITSVEGAPHE